MPVLFRPHKESDINFIFATLLKSYRFCNPIAKAQPSHSYYRSGSDELHDMLNCDVKIMIACDSEDQDLIVSFLIYRLNDDEQVIHYVYTKAAFRSAGIAKDLCKASGLNISKRTYYSRWTLDVMRLALEDKYNLRYNPYFFNWHWQKPLNGEDNERTNREDC